MKGNFFKPMSANPGKKTAAAMRHPAPTTGVTGIQPVPKKPQMSPFQAGEDPLARGEHGSPGRKEIRATTHRVMGARQSLRQLERSGQPRKKR